MKVLDHFKFEELKGSTLMRKEPVGVCGLITPWNWPMNQIVTKVAPALAAGCTMVLKPSEMAPLSAYLFAQILHEAAVPPGVFNLVNGDGPTVGAAIASHPDVAMVSFTGSTRAGIAVAMAAAPTVKRVTQELGGKSANILLDDADFEKAVPQGVQECFRNAGQSCNAPTRMLVPRSKMAEVVVAARLSAEATKVGDPFTDGISIGPLASKPQFEKVQRLINAGIQEGATLVAGGPGRPDGFTKGYFVKPTVFADVRNDMTIAREEIFGPVLSIIPYEDEDDAVRIANDTPYGLSGFVTVRKSGTGPPRRSADSIWKRAREWRPGRLRRLFWRLQTVGQRQRMGRGRPGRIPRIKSSFRLRAREIGFTCGIVTSVSKIERPNQDGTARPGIPITHWFTYTYRSSQTEPSASIMCFPPVSTCALSPFRSVPKN